MKIVQILPELESGGVERGTLEISKALVEAGHESIVISNGGRLVPQLEAEGGRHIQMPVHKKSLFSLLQIKHLRRLLLEEGIDIIHARSRVPAWISYLAWKGLRKESHTRFMTTFHGFHSVSPYSEIMTKGERVIAVSESVKNHIRENYANTDMNKVAVVHRGVSDSDYTFDYEPPANSRVQELRVSAGNAFIITLPGRITGWKGGEDFIEVIFALKEKGIPVQGWFAGGAHEKKQDFLYALKDQVNALELNNEIRFLGHRSDLKDIMAVSDVVLTLSTKPEAFGRVSLEALRLGIPVAGYSHGGVQEQLSALFPEGEIELGNKGALVSLLEQWYKECPIVPNIDNPFSLEKMQEGCLKIYSDLFNETTHAKLSQE